MTTHAPTPSPADTTDIAPFPLTPGRWALDPNHSRIGFAIRHLGVSKVRGLFRDYTVELFVGTGAADSSLVVTVALESIDTGNADRDAHVRSPDLLDVATRPTMTFRATELQAPTTTAPSSATSPSAPSPSPSSSTVEFGGVETFPGDGSRHAGFEATGQIRRSDYGLDFGMVGGGLLGDVVKLELDVQLVEADPA